MTAQQQTDARRIENVWSRYARNMDMTDQSGVLELFTEDCHVDLASWGTYEGKTEFREFLEEFFAGEKGIQASFHGFFNPILEVDDDEAVGKWHYLGADTFDGPVAGWLFGFYTNEFVRVDGEWRIDRLVFDGKWFTSFEEGWAEQPDMFS